MNGEGSPRIKDVDLALLPHRLVLTYEEAALMLCRSKRYVEDLVATKQLPIIEPGRISRRHVEEYVARLEIQALHPQQARSPVRPKRRSAR